MTNTNITHIDGSLGEGGGQVLRSCLALSAAFNRPFHLKNIRSGRPKPGLKRQHLACVKAVGEICSAEITGAAINSGELIFKPGGPAKGGDYVFDIGGGGSCTLVLQAALPPLMTAEAPSRLKVRGGTHVPLAPIYEFFAESLIPRLNRLGPGISARLVKTGFMQVGGGEIEVNIEPVPRLTPFEETQAGEFIDLTGHIRSFGLSESIAEREAAVFKKLRDLKDVEVRHFSPDDSGPGNLVYLKLVQSCGVTIASGLAQRGLAAEKVARAALDRLLRFMSARVPVDAYLADQLIVPLALAGGGCFLTEKPSLHALTVLDILPKFTGLKAQAREIGPKAWLVEIAAP